MRFKNEVLTFTNHEDLKDKADILFSIGGMEHSLALYLLLEIVIFLF